MKISRSQKLKNRKQLIKSAVSLFLHQGFKNTTMREIAKTAKLSEPAIYNYFPTKESLVFAYFEDMLEESLQNLYAKKIFLQLGFCEKVQALIEIHLENLEPHRDFVSDSFQSIFVTDLPSSSTAIAGQKKIFLAFIQEQLKESQSKGELPSSPFDVFFSELLWDFYIGVLYYWLKDDSQNYENTSQMVDKSLALLRELLKTEVVTKFLDIVQFFLRQHLFKALTSLSLERGPFRENKETKI